MNSTKNNHQNAEKAYLASVKASGMSQQTVESYCRAIDLFMEFSGGELSTAKLTEYKISLHEKGCSQNTIGTYIKELNYFCAWMVENGYMENNPVTPSLLKTKVPPKKAYENLLSRDEILKLLDPQMPIGYRKKTWCLHHAIAVVFLTSGIRNSELRDLTAQDLDFEHWQIRVRNGKGGKERFVAFPEIAQNAVKKYMVSTRPQNLPDDAPLFGVGNSVEKFHQVERQDLSDRMERHVYSVTGRRGIRTHALRHANASFLLSSGVGIEMLQELLGHSNVQTTKIYASYLRPETVTDAAAAAFSV